MIPYSFKILADILHLHIRNDSCDFRLMASVFFTACDTKPFAGSRVSPRRRLTFNETNCVGFLASPRKASKRRRPHCPCPFGCAYGQPVVLARRAGRRTRCALARSAQTAAASQSTKLVCPAAHQHAPRTALLGMSRGEKRGYRNAAAPPTPQQKIQAKSASNPYPASASSYAF